MNPAITVTDLGKTYVVPEREGGVRAALAALVKRRTRDVQAVAEVSFTVEPGEIVGFLGPNGAGQDHHAEDAGRAAAPDQRHRRRPRLHAVAAGP